MKQMCGCALKLYFVIEKLDIVRLYLPPIAMYGLSSNASARSQCIRGARGASNFRPIRGRSRVGLVKLWLRIASGLRLGP